MTFDKHQLLKTFAPRVVPVTIDHDGKSVAVFARELSARQVFDLQALQRTGIDSSQFGINLLAQALCDEDGKTVFSVTEVETLAEMQVGAFNKLATAVAQAAGLTSVADKAPEKAAEIAEQPAKDSKEVKRPNA